MTIHKEGRTELIVLTMVLLALNAGLMVFEVGAVVQNGSLLVSVVLFILVLQFFRHPRVEALVDDNLIVAPADGKVVVIEQVMEEEVFKSPKTQISIFMSPVDVHVNRNPVSGEVSYFKYHPGKYLVAWHPKSSTENERTTVVVKMKNELEVMYRQIAGAVARRIKYYIDEGDKVVQGGEFGFIKFGSRVDILLPEDFEVKVKIGDRTKAGRTVLAALKS